MLQVPSGSRMPVDYADPAAPVLAVRLQEMFGQTETPTVGGGRVPVTLHLLSPARRPVQVTRDLAGFWRTTYFEVRKDLKGRYPKHHWPDDPLRAEPTRHAKRRGPGELEGATACWSVACNGARRRSSCAESVAGVARTQHAT